MRGNKQGDTIELLSSDDEEEDRKLPARMDDDSSDYFNFKVIDENHTQVDLANKGSSSMAISTGNINRSNCARDMDGSRTGVKIPRNNYLSTGALDDDDDDLINGPAIFSNTFSQSSVNTHISYSQQTNVNVSCVNRLNESDNMLTTTNRSNSHNLSRTEKLEEKRRKVEEEKYQRKQKKADEREEKKRQLEEEKQQKKNEKETLKAAKGAYAKKEICCLIESGLASSEIGTELHTALAEEEYTVVARDYQIKNSVRFTRQDIKYGGAAVDGNHVKHFGKHLFQQVFAMNCIYLLLIIS